MNFECYEIAKMTNVRGSLPRLILVHLAVYANQDGEAWPSLKTLAGICGTDEKSIRRALNVLVDGEELGIQRGGGRGHVTIYRFLKAGHEASVSIENRGHSAPVSIDKEGRYASVSVNKEGHEAPDSSDKQGHEASVSKIKGGMAPVKGGMAPPEELRNINNTHPLPPQGGDGVCVGSDETLIRKPGQAKDDPSQTQWIYELWRMLAHPDLRRLSTGWTMDHHKAAQDLIARYGGADQFRDLWEKAINEHINRSPFLLGQTEHRHNTTLNWILGMTGKPYVFSNILAGQYDDRDPDEGEADQGEPEASSPRPRAVSYWETEEGRAFVNGKGTGNEHAGK